MRIRHRPKLIVGWMLDSSIVADRMTQTGAHNCLVESQCICEDCISSMFGIPIGWEIVSWAPYYDTSNENMCVALRLKPEDDDQMSHERLRTIYEDPTCVAEAESFARSLGATCPLMLSAKVGVS